jgi:RNA polymerase sigma factor (TIGR02999 family)
VNTEVSLEIRSLMSRFRAGDRAAADALVDHFYPELRRIAAARMRTERLGHTWTPTVLVNELYLELVKIKALRAAHEDSSEREAFLSLAGHIMRRLLIHHSRPMYRRAHKVEVNEIELSERGAVHEGPETLAEVDDLLDRLKKMDPRLRTVVELRAFEGKTTDEAAQAMGCSPRTVDRCWNFARHWLASELGNSEGV